MRPARTRHDLLPGCSIAAIGSGYTLTASDPTDGVRGRQSAPFTITAGVPVQLVFTQQPGDGTGGTRWISVTQPNPCLSRGRPGNLVITDHLTITLAMGTNPRNGTLS